MHYCVTSRAWTVAIAVWRESECKWHFRNKIKAAWLWLDGVGDEASHTTNINYWNARQSDIRCFSTDVAKSWVKKKILMTLYQFNWKERLLGSRERKTPVSQGGCPTESPDVHHVRPNLLSPWDFVSVTAVTVTLLTLTQQKGVGAVVEALWWWWSVIWGTVALF